MNSETDISIIKQAEELNHFVNILTDDRRIISGGNNLQSWASDLFNALLEHRNIFGCGGLLVPQIGKDSGIPKSFTCRDIEHTLSIDEKSVKSALDDYWSTSRYQEKCYPINMHNCKDNYVLAIYPTNFGFEKPIGYYWVIVKNSDYNSIRGLLRYASVLSSICIRSHKACNALDLLGKPCWMSMNTNESTARYAAELCKRSLGCRAVIIWKKKHTRRVNHLTTLVSIGEGCEDLAVDMEFGEGLAGKCAEDNEFLNIDDLYYEKNRTAHPDIVMSKGFRSAIFIPIDIGGEVAGVLGIYGERPSAFSKLDEDIAKSIAQLFSMGYIHTRRIQEVSTMENKIRLESPVIETGLFAMSRVHDVLNKLGGAQDSLNNIKVRAKNDKLKYISDEATKASNDIRKAYKTVNALRNRAKLKAANVKKCDVKEFLGDVLKSFENQFDGSRVRVCLNCRENIFFNVDSEQMERVFGNLIDNSLYFLETIPREGKIDINVEEKGSVVQIRFRDNGPGIAPYEIDQIFNMFFTTKGNKGLGFGLEIAQKIISEHNGTIKAISEWGNFTEFIISLPKSGG